MAQLGIFRVKDATKAAGDQFQSWIDRGLVDPTNLREFAAASNYTAKTIEDAADAAKVAGSALPMFQSALNEATNARRQLDSLFVDTMNVNRGFFVEFGQNLRQGASAWDSFKKAGSDALGHIADKLMQMAADNLFANAFGGKSGGGLFGFLGGLLGGSAPTMSSGLGAGTGGLSFPMFADGGLIRGPGGPRSDSIPALLSNGEFVVNAAATSRFGPLLKAINEGGAKFALGGIAAMAPGAECGPELILKRVAA